MIAFVRGRLAASDEDHICIDVGGIGYEISVHQRILANLPPPGTEMTVYTYYQVLENEVRLYGFASPGELAMFKKIITVSGFGAKGAMSILSAVNSADFVRAVRSSDEKRLTAIPGIGKKTAQRLIFELKDKLGGAFDSGQSVEAETVRSSGVADDVLDALEALGYGRSEVVSAVAEVLASGDDNMKAETAIRLVLKKMAR